MRCTRTAEVVNPDLLKPPAGDAEPVFGCFKHNACADAQAQVKRVLIHYEVIEVMRCGSTRVRTHPKGRNTVFSAEAASDYDYLDTSVGGCRVVAAPPDRDGKRKGYRCQETKAHDLHFATAPRS